MCSRIRVFWIFILESREDLTPIILGEFKLHHDHHTGLRQHFFVITRNGGIDVWKQSVEFHPCYIQWHSGFNLFIWRSRPWYQVMPTVRKHIFTVIPLQEFSTAFTSVSKDYLATRVFIDQVLEHETVHFNITTFSSHHKSELGNSSLYF